MQIIIDIDENLYTRLFDNGAIDAVDMLKACVAIRKGTPLPKGRWIHRTQDGGCFWEECSVCHTERAFPTKYCPDCGAYMYADIRTKALAIIEADKESEDKE